MESYIDRLVIELRMRDVPGNRIGQIVAEVETHAADSGEDPAEAFGDPATYSEQVATELRHPDQPSPVGRSLLIAYPAFLGTGLAFEGVITALTGGRVEIAPGHLLVAAALPAAVPLLLSWLTRTRDRRSLWLLWLVGTLITAATVAVLYLFREPVLLQFPAWASIAAGVALLVVGGRHLRRDPVIDPRDGRDRCAPTPATRVAMIAMIAVPIVALLLIAVLTA